MSLRKTIVVLGIVFLAGYCFAQDTVVQAFSGDKRPEHTPLHGHGIPSPDLLVLAERDRLGVGPVLPGHFQLWLFSQEFQPTAELSFFGEKRMEYLPINPIGVIAVAPG